MSEQILQSSDILIYLQNSFCLSLCDEIYDKDSEHLYKKWLYCDGNLLKFITMLDKSNKLKLLLWGYIKYQDELR